MLPHHSAILTLHLHSQGKHQLVIFREERWLQYAGLLVWGVCEERNRKMVTCVDSAEPQKLAYKQQ